MVVTNTQDEFEIRSIDVVHINPSVMEGERGRSSILGPRTAIPIVRFAPTFEVQPTVSGNLRIPSILTCNPGVIVASPTADIFYQWQAAGVDIPGETNKTLITTLVLDAVEVTCIVDAVNFLGTASGVSNGITPERVEPIITHQTDFYATTGMGQENLLLTHNARAAIATGMSADGRLDTISDSAFVVSGLSATDRSDVLDTPAFVTTGLSAENRHDVFSLEAYAAWRPTYLQPVALINPSAESGDMTGWTVTNGIITSSNVIKSSAPATFDGGRYFSGSDTVGDFTFVDDAIMNQVVNFDAGLFTDIDDLRMYVEMRFRFSWDSVSAGNIVRGNITLLDISDTVLLTQDVVEIQDTSTWTDNWSELILIPATTRKIKIQFTLIQDYLRVDAHVDDIRVDLYKDM